MKAGHSWLICVLLFSYVKLETNKCVSWCTSVFFVLYLRLCIVLMVKAFYSIICINFGISRLKMLTIICINCPRTVLAHCHACNWMRLAIFTQFDVSAARVPSSREFEDRGLPPPTASLRDSMIAMHLVQWSRHRSQVYLYRECQDVIRWVLLGVWSNYMMLRLLWLLRWV